MYPLLFDHGDVNFERLGKGKLTDVASFVIYEELNGEYTAEFTYPITGPRINDLYAGGTVIVYGPSYNPNNTPETTIDGVMFDITGHSLAIDGMVTFHCQHLSRRLAYSVMYAGTVNYNFGIYARPSINNLDGADISISIPSGNSFTLEAPKSVIACLIGGEQSFTADCGFDFAFRTPVNIVPAKARCNCYAISGGRGADRGAQVRYGYNMISYDQSIDRRQSFNCVYPFYKDSNGTITYASTTISNRVIYPTTQITPPVCVPLDVSSEFENPPTGAEIATFAQNYLDNNTPWNVEDEITVNFLNGAEIDPHAPHIELGDIISVYWADAGITTKQRVISYRYDVLQECYIEMTLGKIANNFVAITGMDNFAASGGGGGGGGGGGTLYFQSQAVNVATNAEIFRITDGSITTNTVVVECTFATPSYISSDITWTSYNGYIAFTGTCTAATTADVTLSEAQVI